MRAKLARVLAAARAAVGARRGAGPPPPLRDWLLACVAENDARYLAQAERFVQSVRWLPGDAAALRVRVHVVDGVAPAARAALEELGAEVRVVPRFLASNPFANKLQAFLAGDWDEAAFYLLCDCDTLIVRDPRPFLRGGVFQAKIADLPSVGHAAFERVFAHFGLPLPARAFVTDFRPTPTIPYFNSGVVAMPRAVARRVVPVWREVNARLVERLDLLGAEAKHVNQASLAVALARLREPVRALPREMNFPVHLLAHEAPAGFGECDPVIVHYHDEVDDRGFVREPPYPAAAARVREFNARRRAAAGAAAPAAAQAAPAVLLGGVEAAGSSPPTELILTGISRSGTSWLAHLLHGHRDCVVVNEPAEVVAALAAGDPGAVAAYFAATRRRILARQPILNKLTDGEVTTDTAANDERVAYLPEPETAGFVLAVKNTRAFLSRLDQVQQAMPQARVLACVRNPFDTIGSWKTSFAHLRDADLVNVPVGHPEDPWIEPAARAELRAIAAVTDVAERRARWWRWFAEVLLRRRDRLVLLRYEDLVADPQASLAAALAGYRLGRPRRTLEPSSPRLSRRHLDDRDREVIREVCLDAARELGVAG